MTWKGKLMVPLVVLLAGCMQVFASDGLTATCDAPKVSVRIAAETLAPGEMASCVILPADVEYTTLTREQLLESAAYAGQLSASADGSGTLDIAMPASTVPAQYAVYVKTETNLLRAPFYFMDAQGKQQIVKEFDQADAEGIGALLRKYSVDTPVLAIDTEGLYTEIEAEINAALLAYRDIAGSFGTLENIETVFNQSLALYVVNHAEEAELGQALEEQAAVLELPVDEIYQQNKAAVLDMFVSYREAQSGSIFATAEAVRDAYMKSYVTAQINAIEKISEMDAWVVQYADVLGIDADTYAKYENPSIGSALIGQEFPDAASVKRKIEQRMEDLDDAKGSGHGGGGGGGGSISSGSSRPSGSGSQGPVYTPVPGNGAEEPPAEDGQFADIGDAPWASEAIAYLHQAGFVNGKGDNQFAPNDAITRAEFAAILSRSFSLLDASASSDFADVAASDWYYQAVSSLAAAGIINGRGDGTFGSNDVVSRQDMAVMLYRVMEHNGIAPAAVREYTAFDDQAAIAAYAQEAVEKLYEINVINGMGDGTFAPTNGCTRAQVAKAVYDVIVVSK